MGLPLQNLIMRHNSTWDRAALKQESRGSPSRCLKTWATLLRRREWFKQKYQLDRTFGIDEANWLSPGHGCAVNATMIRWPGYVHDLCWLEISRASVPGIEGTVEDLVTKLFLITLALSSSCPGHQWQPIKRQTFDDQSLIQGGFFDCSALKMTKYKEK